MRVRGRFVAALALAGLAMLACAGFNLGALNVSPTGGPDFHIDRPDLSRPLHIVVYGDMRFTDPKETAATNPKVRRWLVDKIAAEKPDAVLLSGDVPWRGGQADDYAVYRSETQSWRDAHLRIYPALGNHELIGAEQQCLEN
jgi:predicted MPP superfamily phosphohydrolase